MFICLFGQLIDRVVASNAPNKTLQSVIKKMAKSINCLLHGVITVESKYGIKCGCSSQFLPIKAPGASSNPACLLGESWQGHVVCIYLGSKHPQVCPDGSSYKAGSKLHRLSGRRIAGPWRFAWVGVKGDNEFIVDVTLAKRWYACNSICRNCLASKSISRLLYTNFSEHAPWVLTITRLEHYIRNTPVEQRHALLDM